MKNIMVMVVIASTLGLGFWLFQTSQTPSPEDLPGVAYDIQGAEHIPEGSLEHPVYNSNPPTSGWHWPQPAPCGVYEQQLPDERLIHNLEHGGIWISYLPDQVRIEDRAKLEDLAKRFNNVLTVPRPQNDTAIAVAAWGHLLKLGNYAEQPILDFIRAFMGQGPEQVGCAHQ